MNSSTDDCNTLICPECEKPFDASAAIDTYYCSDLCADRADANRCSICLRPGRKIVDRDPFPVCIDCVDSWQYFDALEEHFNGPD